MQPTRGVIWFEFKFEQSFLSSRKSSAIKWTDESEIRELNLMFELRFNFTSSRLVFRYMENAFSAPNSVFKEIGSLLESSEWENVF